jgi:hypothetical protein
VPAEEVDPRDVNPNLIPPDQAGDQLPGEPPGVHRKGVAGPDSPEEVEELHKKR